MLRILGLILFVSWIGYPILVLAGASHATTYMTMGFIYIVVGVFFLVGALPLARRFRWFGDKALGEFPPGFARTFALIIFGQVGIHRSKLEWIVVTVFGGGVFLTLGIALVCLGADFVGPFRYLIGFFR